jgi:hypothetical protein
VARQTPDEGLRHGSGVSLTTASGGDAPLRGVSTDTRERERTMNELKDVPVRDRATVTVKKAVDGTKKRRKPSKMTRRAVTTTLSMDDVLPSIAAAARKVRKPGQVFVVVSRECVRVVNQ